VAGARDFGTDFVWLRVLISIGALLTAALAAALTSTRSGEVIEVERQAETSYGEVARDIRLFRRYKLPKLDAADDVDAIVQEFEVFDARMKRIRRGKPMQNPTESAVPSTPAATGHPNLAGASETVSRTGADAPIHD
jgi:hypothetical protein